MPNNPLVSVVVISYNASKTIIETLDSIKAQTYSPLELIIADDCSQDDTAIKCERWLKKNQNVFVNSKLIVNDVNRGISANLNIGIRASSGVWIKVFGDDMLLPDAIENNVAFAIATNCSFVTSRVIPFIDDVDRKELKIAPNNDFVFPTSTHDQLIAFIRNKLIVPSPTWFYKRDLYDSLGGYDEHYRLSDDVPFAYRMLESGGHFSYMQQVTVMYRITNKSTSNSKNLSSEQKRPYFESSSMVFYELLAPALKKNKLYGTLVCKKACYFLYRKKLYTPSNSIMRYLYGALLYVAAKMNYLMNKF